MSTAAQPTTHCYPHATQRQLSAADENLCHERFVDDQDKAEAFYCGTLGFKVKYNIPLGANRWLTVVLEEDPDGPELLLEPSDHASVGPYKDAIFSDNIPALSFQVQNLDADWKKLTKRDVKFVTEPMDAGHVHMAVFDDTCGHLIQLIEMKEAL